MPEDLQEYMASIPGGMMEVVERIDTGHASFLAQPHQVADFIMRACA